MLIQPSPKLPISVTAFLDGNARMIEPPVMRGFDKFQRTGQTKSLNLHVCGQRREFSQEIVEGSKFLAVGGAITAVAAAIGAQFGIEVGTCVGLMAIPPAFVGARRIQSAFTASNFQPGPPANSSILKERFQTALGEARAKNPRGPQVAYLSGHGSHREVAHLQPSEIGEAFNARPVQLTILDACSTAQLEVLSKLGPGAGEVVCSPHPVPAGGFPIEKLFRSSEGLAESTYQESKNSTAHLALVDNRKLTGRLLPSLGGLAAALQDDLSHTEKLIHQALKKSRNPDLVGARADLSSFLQNLTAEDLNPVCREALDQAMTSLKETVPADTGWSLTFRVDGKENEALPEAWNGLFKELGYRWKPFLI